MNNAIETSAIKIEVPKEVEEVFYELMNKSLYETEKGFFIHLLASYREKEKSDELMKIAVSAANEARKIIHSYEYDYRNYRTKNVGSRDPLFDYITDEDMKELPF